jgi:hypothetical protein
MVSDTRDAGLLRDGAGLRSTAHGVRITFAGGKRTVVKGPYACAPPPSVCYPLAHHWRLCACLVLAYGEVIADLLSGVWRASGGAPRGMSDL